ncbi:MAG TPA: methyltransferase domain-containing protein [Alphaproteobacteria bacterium]|nr:methyltransferase domain-containing protein [Alphaproteobacteria bacterium]
MISAKRIARGLRGRFSRQAVRLRAALRSERTRHCAACGADIVGFFSYGPTEDWGCPACGSSPRERFVGHIVASGRLRLPAPGSRILHVAPSEKSLVALFETASCDYVRADLFPEAYKDQPVRRLDLCAFPEGEPPYDLIYASHVLEHIPDDMQAMREIRAHLAPSGEAWIIVPLHDLPTEESTPEMTRRERERRFGQWDHVRQYGEDVAERLRAAGFAIERIAAVDLPDDLRRHEGLVDADVLWRCRREGA